MALDSPGSTLCMRSSRGPPVRKLPLNPCGQGFWRRLRPARAPSKHRLQAVSGGPPENCLWTIWPDLCGGAAQSHPREVLWKQTPEVSKSGMMFSGPIWKGPGNVHQYLTPGRRQPPVGPSCGQGEGGGD